MEFYSNCKKYEDKIEQLESDKQNLIKDNITLIKENEYLKEQINVTFKSEHEKLLKFHNERVNKQNEIQRLLENNLTVRI